MKTASVYEYVYGDGAIVVNAGRGELVVDGERRRVEPTPLGYLIRLMHSPNTLHPLQRGLDADRLRNLTTALSRLRKALGERYSKLIVTKRGKGYWFDGEVNRRLVVPKQERPSLRKRDRVGDTLLESPLGARDGIEVWSGHQAKRQVVLKLAASPSALPRLRHEMALWQRLQGQFGAAHPGLALPVEDGLAAAPPYLCFPHRGVDLQSWRDALDSPPTTAQRMAIATGLVDAVGQLHRAGIAHGDLNPSNVLIQQEPATEAPTVTLVDLGSASLADSHRDAAPSASDTPLAGILDAGTLIYLAPERIEGEASVSADIYALGVMLFQLVSDDLRRPMVTGWERDVDDPAIRELLARATDGNLTQRFGSVGEVRSALLRLPQRREEIRKLARFERFEAMRPWIASLIGVLLVAVLLVTGFAWDATTARRKAEGEREVTESVTEFFTLILRAADPRSEASLSGRPLSDALQRAQASLDRQEPRDLATRIEINRALIDIFNGLGSTQALLNEAERAVELNTTAQGDSSAAALAARYRLAVLLAENGRAGDAQGVLQRITGTERHSPAQTVELDRLEAFAEARISAATYDFPKARELLAPAVASYGENRFDATYDSLVLTFAEANARSGDPQAALALIDELQANQERYQLEVPTWRRLDQNRLKGQILGIVGRQREAVQVLEEVLAGTEQMYGQNSQRVAWVLSALGQQENSLGNREQALRYYERSAAIFCEREMLQMCASAKGNLGALQYVMGEPQAALDSLTAASERLRSLTQDQSVALTLFDFFSANALLDLQRVQEAQERVARLSVEVLERAAPGAAWRQRVALLVERLRLYQEGGDPAHLFALAEQLEGLTDVEVRRFTALPINAD